MITALIYYCLHKQHKTAAMNETLPNITELRNNIDFASISQFFHTFQSAFHPWPTSTQQLIYRTRIEEGQEYVFETEVKKENNERKRIDCATIVSILFLFA